MYKNLIFDLDGTLLDTITDIRAAINAALTQCGFSYSFSKSDCRSLIGDGADALVHRALKENDNPSNFSQLKEAYMPLYAEMQNRHTKPFNGLIPTLTYLKIKGFRLFVCTNKPDVLAKKIILEKFGSELFEEVRGLKEGEKPKPDPGVVNYFISKFGLERSECLFVGDSLPDLLTSQNAKLPLCLCEWGYGFYKPELLNECAIVIKKPKDLAKVVL